MKPFEAVVIGVSAGGLAALEAILPVLDESFGLPVLVVQHLSPDAESYLPQHLDIRCVLRAKEAEDKEPLKPGTVYVAPPNYHLMVEADKTIALSTEQRVNFSRPSVDVLFETAAEVFCQGLVGVILTGANSDGAAGVVKVKQYGGMVVVQDPETAAADAMPRAAIQAVTPDHVLPLERIGPFLKTLAP
ncbi:chemotaxis protein CheB [Desulfoluna spongiiphila]|uniref:protein-glutamate methylesterase n=1 Tax=Desulfoluna spongiiphila TaxID=419481 RepID=A0A1G5DWU6_9BACT|nr:chemotaxis protein CheB [Desulfoluna spongiiphila]SCY19125.1 CheB methylesterase [Desulfoluna spongiiphila]VVS91463.1 signal transduction response regulator chemotaxis protein-glutamate methylesterase [Desulfoluna spongiiphila]